jgi:6-phosphogluconolactonase
MKLVVVETADLAAIAARLIAEEARVHASALGHCSVALAGGNTPRPIYAELARMPRDSLSIEKLDFYFGDERCVPPDDPQSNYRMAREALFEPAGIDAARIHRIEAERPDRDLAAADYQAVLPDPLDILILGLGEDGHVASIFPRSSTLRETARRVVAVQGPKPPPWRITITPPVIRAARTVLVAAAGKEKAAVAARALLGDEHHEDIPAQLASTGIWVLDRDAAALVGKGT